MVKLSIVIPYYQTYELTCKLLNVLVPQLTEETEVFLIDDGCKEKRLDIYKDKINIIHLKENKGGAYASNVGIDKAKGKYIGFIDSDDMVVPYYIETLIDAINNHEEDVIFMDWQDLNSGLIIQRPNNYAAWKAIYKKEITPRFPNGRTYSYDVPFYDELNAKGYTKHYLDRILYLYNSGRPDSLTARKRKVINENNNSSV